MCVCAFYVFNGVVLCTNENHNAHPPSPKKITPIASTSTSVYLQLQDLYVPLQSISTISFGTSTN